MLTLFYKLFNWILFHYFIHLNFNYQAYDQKKETIMKKIVLGLVVLALSVFTVVDASAQREEGASNVLIAKEYKVKKFHTIDELNEMNKGALVTLYKERIEDLFSILPFAALTTQPGVTLDDLGIPSDSRNTQLLSKEATDADNLYKSVESIITGLVPYGDKKDIVWAILLYEDVIKRANVGNDL